MRAATDGSFEGVATLAQLYVALNPRLMNIVRRDVTAAATGVEDA